jgi:photosystem II stability/assembly factor-like uncharacterized protein
VLRNRDGDWETVSIDTALPAGLTGVVFSSPDVAWAFGTRGEGESPVLLRSQDTGTTWADVASNLPAEVEGIVDMAFADASTGYLVAHGLLTPRMLFHTVDGGKAPR